MNTKQNKKSYEETISNLSFNLLLLMDMLGYLFYFFTFTLLLLGINNKSVEVTKTAYSVGILFFLPLFVCCRLYLYSRESEFVKYLDYGDILKKNYAFSLIPVTIMLSKDLERKDTFILLFFIFLMTIIFCINSYIENNRSIANPEKNKPNEYIIMTLLGLSLFANFFALYFYTEVSIRIVLNLKETESLLLTILYLTSPLLLLIIFIIVSIKKPELQSE